MQRTLFDSAGSRLSTHSLEESSAAGPQILPRARFVLDSTEIKARESGSGVSLIPLLSMLDTCSLAALEAELDG
jgi:hypothetical protein